VSERRDEREDLRYESIDANPAAVFRFAALVMGGAIVAGLAALGLFAVLHRAELRGDPPAPPMGVQRPGQLPPEPRLQPLGAGAPGQSPSQELRSVLAEERRRLTTYGWVDEQKGVVRIPIEDAMEVLARRGLPSAAEPPSPPAVPTEASAPFPRPSPPATEPRR